MQNIARFYKQCMQYLETIRFFARPKTRKLTKIELQESYKRDIFKADKGLVIYFHFSV